MQAFPLAPMSGIVRGLTWLLLGLPALFLGIGVSVPNPESRVLCVTGLGVALLYLGIWLYSRPTRFELTPAELVLVWPVRRRRIPRSDIRRVRLLDREAIRPELGWTIRVGAGGLWGTFGWLWTSRLGKVDTYVSRADHWVLVERAAGRPLLINPERPEEFVRAAG